MPRGEKGRHFQKGQPRSPNSGRRKGVRNRSTVVREAAERIAKRKQISPLEFLEELINDPRAGKKLRCDASKAAAPYVHKRMPIAIEHSGKDGQPLSPTSMNVTFVTPSPLTVTGDKSK
jgi:hypothetical protein